MSSIKLTKTQKLVIKNLTKLIQSQKSTVCMTLDKEEIQNLNRKLDNMYLKISKSLGIKKSDLIDYLTSKKYQAYFNYKV